MNHPHLFRPLDTGLFHPKRDPAFSKEFFSTESLPLGSTFGLKAAWNERGPLLVLKSWINSMEWKLIVA
jgi:hypothetical protein